MAENQLVDGGHCMVEVEVCKKAEMLSEFLLATKEVL